MLTTGTKEEIAAGKVLIRQGEPVNALYILLDGELLVSLSQSDNNPLGRAFAALEGGEMSGREIARLSSGDMVGEIPFLDTYLPSTSVKAITNSLVAT